MMREPEQLTGLADVIAATTEDGEVRLKIGFVNQELGIADEVPQYGPDGFFGVPLAPDPNGDCAQAFYFVDGHGKICGGVRDNRLAEKVGAFAEGDRGIVGHGEARFFLKHDRDAITAYTENQNSDESMMLDLDGSAGQITIVNGKSFITMTENEIVLGVGGSVSLTLNEQTIAAICSAFQAVAGAVQLGDVGGGIPVPALPVAAAAYGVAGPVNTISTKVFVAT